MRIDLLKEAPLTNDIGQWVKADYIGYQPAYAAPEVDYNSGIAAGTIDCQFRPFPPNVLDIKGYGVSYLGQAIMYGEIVAQGPPNSIGIFSIEWISQDMN
jgi:hypothetical protein